jgi:hypothetical protein
MRVRSVVDVGERRRVVVIVVVVVAVGMIMAAAVIVWALRRAGTRTSAILAHGGQTPRFAGSSARLLLCIGHERSFPVHVPAG